MVRKILLAALVLLLAAFAAFYWYMRPLPILTVTTWPGDYGHAQQVAQMHPFAAANRVDVHIADWEGRLTDIKGDVIDFELPRVVEACERGMLEKIDAATLPAGADGKPAAEDFVPGAIGPCWVGAMVYSQVMVFSPKLKRMPATLADFFNTRAIPGKRALSRAAPKFNLEMALLPTTRLGGHLVSGHVDGVGHILERVDDGRSWRFTLEAPQELARYIAEKGSICINGISLTVNAVSGAQFTVNIVPHTLQETTLGTSSQGDAVNLEVDLIARYLERLLLGEKAGIPASGVTMALLQDNGFA